MQLQVLCFGAMIGSLLTVMPTSTAAQSLPGTNPLPCQMVDNPTSETYCRPLADTVLPRGVTVAASDGSLALVDSVRVIGAFSLDGPTIQVIGGEPVVAQSSQDVLTTGSNVQTRAFSTLVEPGELRRRWAHSFIGLYLEQSGSNDAQGAAPPYLVLPPPPPPRSSRHRAPMPWRHRQTRPHHASHSPPPRRLPRQWRPPFGA